MSEAPASGGHPSPARKPAATRGQSSKFGQRLALAFAAVAALTVAFTAVVIAGTWNYEFDRYVRGNLQKISDDVAQLASQAYPIYGGWTIQTLSSIPRFGPMRGYAIQILNAHDDVIYDDTTQYVNPSNAQSLESQEQTVVIKPAGPLVSSPVLVRGVQVGTVRVWALNSPSALLSDRDIQFRQASIRALALAGLIAIVLATLSGMAYASRLVRPIAKITATADALRRGEGDARTGMEGEDEISVLGMTFDQMADSIESDRELERRLTADVAHELRTPLQAIQATVEAMQDGVLPADEERLSTVRDETVRLGRLADGILELTRLERGSLPFDMNRLDLTVRVRAAVEAHEALFEASELTLVADLRPGITIVGDADRIQQAVSNLLSNAARYTPAGGRVDVRLAARNGCAVLEVDDTGIGIAEEDMARLFSRFWRADGARARSTGGLGIGLSVTKEIVERHRGTIAATALPGGGSRFTVSIPLV